MKRKKQQPMSLDDRKFFHEFYNDNKKFMYYIARQYAPNPADCEDVIQEALVRLINNISTLREINRCKTASYIVATIRTTFLDYEKRKKKGHLLFYDDETLEALFANQVLPHDPDKYISANTAISKLKSQLSARDWLVLEGKYLLGYSQEELGHLIGVSPDSVRMVLFRAREKAKAILENDAV